MEGVKLRETPWGREKFPRFPKPGFVKNPPFFLEGKFRIAFLRGFWSNLLLGAAPTAGNRMIIGPIFQHSEQRSSGQIPVAAWVQKKC